MHILYNLFLKRNGGIYKKIVTSIGESLWFIFVETKILVKFVTAAKLFNNYHGWLQGQDLGYRASSRSLIYNEIADL